MIKKLLMMALALSLYAGAAAAQTCSAVPNTLTNGTPADATQVMANFNYLLACASDLRGYLGGLTMANDTGTPNTVIDTSAGVANSDDATTMMTLAAFTKNANASWAPGAGNGCLDSGSTLVASTWYHLFVISRTDTGVVDELCSTSATAPNTNVTGWPSGSIKKRRIGSFRTDANAHIMLFTQFGNQFTWHSALPDVDTSNLGTTPTLFQLTVPTGVKVNALIRAIIGGAGFIAINGPDESLPIAGNSPAIGASGTGNWNEGVFNVLTNTSAQIFAVADSAGRTFAVTTYGWLDQRGQ